MRGLMMNTPLLISSILRHADLNYPDLEIFSVTGDNPEHRYTYAECFRRARQLANALDRLNLDDGDRVATIAWNDYRHLEIYYSVGAQPVQRGSAAWIPAITSRVIGIESQPCSSSQIRSYCGSALM